MSKKVSEKVVDFYYTCDFCKFVYNITFCKPRYCMHNHSICETCIMKTGKEQTKCQWPDCDSYINLVSMKHMGVSFLGNLIKFVLFEKGLLNSGFLTFHDLSNLQRAGDNSTRIAITNSPAVYCSEHLVFNFSNMIARGKSEKMDEWLNVRPGFKVTSLCIKLMEDKSCVLGEDILTSQTNIRTMRITNSFCYIPCEISGLLTFVQLRAYSLRELCFYGVSTLKASHLAELYNLALTVLSVVKCSNVRFYELLIGIVSNSHATLKSLEYQSVNGHHNYRQWYGDDSHGKYYADMKRIIGESSCLSVLRLSYDIQSMCNVKRLKREGCNGRHISYRNPTSYNPDGTKASVRKQQHTNWGGIGNKLLHQQCASEVSDEEDNEERNNSEKNVGNKRKYVDGSD